MKGSVKLPVFIDDARKYVNTTQLRAKYLGASYEAEYCQWQTLHGLGSLMETASLIITPNAYLEGKLIASYPPDPIGDFDVTRATTATRVNSAGLVELVPYNLVQYSEQFDNAYWSKNAVTITPNTTAAPNGTLTADTLTNSSTGYGLFSIVSVAPSTQYTFSFYVKKGTNTSYILSVIDANTFASIDSLDYSSQVGTEWVRVSTTFTTLSGTTSIRVYPMRDGSSTGTAFLWGAQLVEGSTAKDYQKTETRLNIPRLDYSNGTCQSLLVEPQRTNLLTYSSSFDNAAWTKNSVTITANATTSPSGVQDADKMILGNGSQTEPVAFQLLDTTANTRTLTFFAKASEYNIAFARVGGSVTVPIVLFELSGNGSILHNQNALSYSIEPLENGWYRCSMTYAHGTAFAPNVGVCSPTYSVSSTSVTSTGNGTSGIFIWGAQVEVGNYASSYIPTTSASVTRNADELIKTSATALIGQTEGTILLDVYRKANSEFIVFFSKGTTTPQYVDVIYFYQTTNGNFIIECYKNNVLQFNLPLIGGLNVGNNKMALAYSQTDIALYVNGFLTATDNYADLPEMNNICINTLDIINTANFGVNALALWKTRLTNTQLAQLTTI